MKKTNTETVQKSDLFTLTSKKTFATIGLLVITLFVPYHEGEHIVPFPIGVFSKIFEFLGYFTSYKSGSYYECRFEGCIEFGMFVSLALTLILYYVVACLLLSLVSRKPQSKSS